MSQGKQPWDTRAWLVGVLGGVVGGSITGWADYPPIVRRINQVVHSANAANWINSADVFLGLLVLPCVLSGIARRRTFLWGLVPVASFLIAAETEDGIAHGWRSVATDWWMPLLVSGCSFLISSGPVSLFRYRHGRARRRREAALASLVAQREAASIPQEGVWPPPPDYR